MLILLGVGLGLVYEAPQQITRGPYLQSATPTGIVVRWRTENPSRSVVRYGPASDQLSSIAEGPAGDTTEHEVRLHGLMPGQRYFYRVGDQTGGNGPSHFRTPPEADSDETVRVWVVGDSGTGDNSSAAVRDGFLTFAGDREADLWLLLGDNAYPDGTDQNYQSAFFDSYPDLLRRTVVWPAYGNHDAHSADAARQSGPYFEIFTLPSSGQAGGVPSGTEAYYAFDHGQVHFIALDSSQSDRSADGAMLRWLAEDLAANRKPWVIAFWHHPPYSKGKHDSDRKRRMIEMRENALPILEASGVDLVLSGHSHGYERSHLIAGHYGRSDQFAPPTMILDDSAGPLSKVSRKPCGHGLPGGRNRRLRLARLSFGPPGDGGDRGVARVPSCSDIGPRRLDGAFVGTDGQVLDSFAIEKHP